VDRCSHCRFVTRLLISVVFILNSVGIIYQPILTTGLMERSGQKASPARIVDFDFLNILLGRWIPQLPQSGLRATFANVQRPRPRLIPNRRIL
jgi:hypothetical protein